MAARTIGKPDLNRLRVRFGKDGRLAYLGHLEVINTIERSVRRAGLPFSVGNGFARRMRIQFSQALPVGAASECEYYDLYLTERTDEGEALEHLAAATPATLAPLKAGYVVGRPPALEAWLTRARWEVRIFGADRQLSAARLDDALWGLRGAGHIDFMRGDTPRTIGLDDTLLSWKLHDVPSETGPACVDLVLETRSSNLGALRPAVLLEAAFAREELRGAELDALRVVRVGQWSEGETGALIDPLSVCPVVARRV